jgi:hypothetical protein
VQCNITAGLVAHNLRLLLRRKEALASLRTRQSGLQAALGNWAARGLG